MTYIQPLLLFSCAVLAAGLLRIRTRSGRRLAWCGFVAVFLVSWPPADWLFGLPLEGRYPARPPRWPGNIQAIAVLASGIEPPQFERPYALADYDTFQRCEHAIWIYRQWGPLPVLASEGGGSGRGRGAMVELLRRGGIPDAMIWTENQSRSTHENAVFGAAILHARGVRRVALVVDARSMPRAAACFRKQGIDVFPVPSEFRTLGNWRDELFPDGRAVQRNEVTLHELLGSAWYRLRGWI